MSLLEQLSDALKDKFPDARLNLNFDGKLLTISIVDPSFENLSKVKQHQLVYSVIKPWILDQQVHAVKIESAAKI